MFFNKFIDTCIIIVHLHNYLLIVSNEQSKDVKSVSISKPTQVYNHLNNVVGYSFVSLVLLLCYGILGQHKFN